MKAGCAGQLEGDVLFLTLDTRGSSVNILSPAVGEELVENLHRGLARGARAVVLRSAKRGSFLNGAQLMLAAALRDRGRAEAAVRGLREFYAAMARVEVPTVAAIAGNCFGCGLELALTFDYRVVADTADTYMYLTEVIDYRMTPVFGSTQRLPPLVGLESACDLILFGARKDARAARRIGLCDAVLPRDDMEGGLGRFLDGLERKGWPKRRYRAQPSARAVLLAMQRVKRKIAGLPPNEQPLARQCLEVVRLPFSSAYSFAAGMEAELQSFLDSVVTEESSRAMSFFFIRQAAKHRGIGTSEYTRPRTLAVTVDERLRGFGALLRRRQLAGIDYGGKGGSARVRFVSPDGSVSSSRATTCAVVLGRHQPDLIPRLLRKKTTVAYLPFPRASSPVVELVVPNGRFGVVELFQFLEQSGFAPVVTSATTCFLSDRLLAAYLAPIHRAGASLRQADAALHEFGFSVLPSALVKESRLRARRGSRVSLVDQVLLSLAGTAVLALEDGTISHPSQADLLVHLLLGFPVGRGSLLRWIVRESDAVFLERLALCPDVAQHAAGAARRILTARPAFYG